MRLLIVGTLHGQLTTATAMGQHLLDRLQQAGIVFRTVS